MYCIVVYRPITQCDEIFAAQVFSWIIIKLKELHVTVCSLFRSPGMKDLKCEKNLIVHILYDTQKTLINISVTLLKASQC